MKKARILVVDDEEKIVSLVAWFLRKQGYRCDTASHAVEALEKIENELPMVVLSDVAMPGMNGLEMTRYLREKEPGIRVILTSGTNQPGEATKAGAFNFLDKPINLRTVHSAINQAVRLN